MRGMRGMRGMRADATARLVAYAHLLIDLYTLYRHVLLAKIYEHAFRST